MRLIYLFLITIILSSCASNKIRLVKNKGAHKKVEIVETNQQESSDLILENESSTNKEAELINTSDELKQNIHLPIIISKPINAQKDEDVEVNNDEALKTEKKSKRARDLTIGGFIFNIVVGVLLDPTASITQVLFPVGGLLIILGLIFYIIAKRAQFNTPKGESFLRTTKTIYIIWALLVIISLTIWLAIGGIGW